MFKKINSLIILMIITILLVSCTIDREDKEKDIDPTDPVENVAPEYLLTDEIVVYTESEFKETRMIVELDGEQLRYNPRYNNDNDDIVKVITFRERSLVPLRELAEKLGYEIAWEGAGKKQVLTIKGNGITITTKLNSNEYIITKNGVDTKVLAETPNVKYDSKIYIPVRFIGETFGLEVEWLEKEFKVELTSKEVNE